jgi:hypothetical protein
LESEEPGPVELDPVEFDPVEFDPVEFDPVEFDPVDPDPVDSDPDPAVPDRDLPDPDPAVPDPELFLRRVLGEVAVERELAPAVRVLVEGLVPDAPDAADVDLEVRVLELAEAAEAALDVAGLDAAALLARSSSCSRARTRCWRRATSSRVAIPRTPSWRLTSRWTRRVMISRFF